MFISSNSGSDRSNGAEAASTATATSLAETLNGIFYAKHDTAAFNVCNIMLVRLVLFTTNCSLLRSGTRYDPVFFFCLFCLHQVIDSTGRISLGFFTGSSFSCCSSVYEKHTHTRTQRLLNSFVFKLLYGFSSLSIACLLFRGFLFYLAWLFSKINIVVKTYDRYLLGWFVTSFLAVTEFIAVLVAVVVIVFLLLLSFTCCCWWMTMLTVCDSHAILSVKI